MAASMRGRPVPCAADIYYPKNPKYPGFPTTLYLGKNFTNISGK